jgi:ATP-dependent RNA helicase DDX23/PRP28
VTGSGKTAAFVLPMMVAIKQRPPLTPATVADGPYALVMAPTRELVLQIGEEARKLGQSTGLQVVCVVGGESIEVQHPLAFVHVCMYVCVCLCLCSMLM